MMARHEWVVNVERGEKWNGKDSHMSKPFPHGCLYSFHSPQTVVACDRIKWMQFMLWSFVGILGKKEIDKAYLVYHSHPTQLPSRAPLVPPGHCNGIGQP